MDMVTYGILSKRINGILSGVKSTEVQGSSLIFNFTDGTSQTMTFPTPKDGVSITDVEVDANKHLIVTFSNNTTVDAGLISTVKGDKGDTGAKGKNGIDGKDGIDGTNGVDGISPTVTITESTGRHTVSITDKDGVKSFVVKDGSALDVDNYYTKDEVIAELATKANITDIPVVPVNVSEFTNDAGYIKNTVDNLVHYYNKADTYTQAEVNTLISNINKLTSQIVDQLPTEDIDTSVIYLIKQEDTNAYMQYMYINSAWAELGTTQVDLSDYYKKSEVDTKLAEKADKTELPTVPSVVSAFTNDAGYLTEYTETDPTVPAWAKAENKPTYTAAEVGALPEDTEIPIFTNKAVLDKISEEKVESWDEAVTSAHTHDNKIVLDKFTESDEGEVLYKGKQIASGNLWNGTKEEFNAIEDKDPDTTYVITDDEDEELSLGDLVIDDSSNVATDKTWSANKIRNSIIPYVLIDTTKDIDFNKYVETGYYTPNKSFSTGWFTHSILNAPTVGWLPAGGFSLEVKTFDNTGNAKWFTQVLYSYVETDNNSAPIYIRTFFYDGSKTTFSPWKRMADIDDSKISSGETWSSKKINDTVVLKNTGILYKNAPTSSGTTTFALDISSLGLTPGIYHFKCYVIGNGNVIHCAEGGIGQYDGSYYISIDYKSSYISSIVINGTTITVTTSTAHYHFRLSIQPVEGWIES